MNEKSELLEQLRDVHIPMVSPLPAIGWWLLLLGVVIVVLGAIWWLRRRLRFDWQRDADSELASIRAAVVTAPVAQTLARASALSRRLLLVAQPRDKVASLSNDAWLKQLDLASEQSLFTEGSGRLLRNMPYQRDPQVSTADLHSLLDAIGSLIKVTRARC